MAISEILETQNSLTKVNKICKFICGLIKFVFVIFCVWWLLSSGLLFFSVFNSGGSDHTGVTSLIALALYIADGVVVAVIFVSIIKIFSDPSRGQSPFSMKQVYRSRLISLMLVLYTVLNTVFNWLITSSPNLWNYGQGVQLGDSSLFAIDFAPLIAAAVLFAFSFVFKYGVLLQEFTDDTL